MSVTWQEVPATNRIEYRKRIAGKMVKSAKITDYTRTEREAMATEWNANEVAVAAQSVIEKKANDREALIQGRMRKIAEDELKADGVIT